MKEQLKTAKMNILGVIVGATAGFFAAKKLGKVENKWVLIASATIGALAGSFVESKIKARQGVPTAATVKK